MTKEYNSQITVIIPILPGKNADITIESLKTSNFPKEKIEVIIVEGNNPSRQRNEAIKAAKGDIIFFLDDDVVIDPDIFNQTLKSYDCDNSIVMIGGPNLTPENDSFLQKCFGYVMESYLGSNSMSKRYRIVGKDIRIATEKDLILCNLSGRKDILRNNLFIEELYPGEEGELFNRLLSKGYKLVYDPKVVVYHSRRSTIKSFVRQIFNYGRARVDQIFIRHSSFDVVFLIPILFIMYLISLLVIDNFLYSIPLILYIALCVIFSVIFVIRKKDLRILLLTPWMFPLVHISYGLGFMYGIIKNAILERELKNKNIGKISVVKL